MPSNRVDSDAGTLIAAVSRGRQYLSRGGIQGTECVLASAGHVMDRAGLDVGDPQWCPGRGGQGLNGASVLGGFARVPQVDDKAAALVVFSA
ncbi:hypothetical protein FHX42_001388 [Saccharopolyspora lacisalsi]|uniref:Uncharacterized protein n=1 Tax=Halosaccharopolyspora lacisalsi TaxID=1000566 RepID=A0A839DTH8_9PSEU|nr:hypothetical protein [Halosaccharopolyspora lacisalsi]